MEVAVALGLLVSELSEEPWNGTVITFSANPQLHLVEGDSLKAKTEFVKNMEVGMNTDFQKVFDQILAVAVEGKLSEEQLIRRLFMFSDMEFDEACGNYSKYMEGVYNYEEALDDEVISEKMKEWGNKKGEVWKTDYEVIKEKFHKCGYKRVPEIVFWNLRNSSSTPVVATQDGVALVSGYSKNLLTLFLDQGGIVNPEQVMELAIAGGEYKRLAIHD